MKKAGMDDYMAIGGMVILTIRCSIIQYANTGRKDLHYQLPRDYVRRENVRDGFSYGEFGTFWNGVTSSGMSCLAFFDLWYLSSYGADRENKIVFAIEIIYYAIITCVKSSIVFMYDRFGTCPTYYLHGRRSCLRLIQMFSRIDNFQESMHRHEYPPTRLLYSLHWCGYRSMQTSRQSLGHYATRTRQLHREYRLLLL